jgi:hypothetical protein
LLSALNIALDHFACNELCLVSKSEMELWVEVAVKFDDGLGLSQQLGSDGIHCLLLGFSPFEQALVQGPTRRVGPVR